MKRTRRSPVQILRWLYPRRLRQELGAELDAHLRQSLDLERRSGRRWPRLRAIVITSADAMRLRTFAPEISMTDLMLDLRHALRRFRRQPVFAAAALLTLALGIGSMTSVYAVVHAVLLQPLPWRDPDRLVTVWQVRPEWRENPVLTAYADAGTFSWPAYLQLRDQSAIFEDAAAIATPRITLRGDPNVVVDALQISSSLLPMLGVEPVRGRAFSPEDDIGASGSVLISHETWQRRFGGQSDVLGQPVLLDEEPGVITGILPPGFELAGVRPEFLLPLGRLPESVRASGGNFLLVLARMTPGATTGDAERVVTDVLRQGDPSSNRLSRVTPLLDEQVGGVRRPLWFLLAAAGGVLLIACTNVVGLVVSDASSRRGELLVRAALGAGRARIARQLAVEGLTLGLSGTMLGILLSRWLTPALLTVAPADVPRAHEATLDPMVLSVAVGAGLLASLAFGAGGFIAMTGPGGVGPTAAARVTARRRRLPRMVVSAQTALAFALLVSANLMGETLLRLHQQPTGIDSAGLVLANIAPAPGSRADEALAERLVASLESLPGVEIAAATGAAPFGGNFGTTRVALDGETERTRTTQQIAVTTRYFAAMGLPIVAGRGLATADRTDEPTAVVSRAFADRYLDGRAVGRRFRTSTTYRVVGVAENVTHRHLDEEAAIVFYALGRHLPNQGLTQFVARAEPGGPSPDADAIRRAMQRIDPALAVSSVDRMTDLIARSTAGERFRAALAVTFGALALVIAAIGVYGVVAQGAAARRREVGIRLALGASRSSVFGLIVGHAALAVTVGVAAGLPLAFVAAHAVRSLLFGVSPHAPHVFALAGLALGSAALAAAWGPARRSGRVAPVEVLRCE